MPPEKFNYDDHAKSCDPQDFWAQVNRRTINGTAVGEDQITLIVGAISAGLEVKANDVILDIGCGNGALSDRIFAGCTGGHGVDLSEYLIGVAQANFGQRAGVQYTVADALDFVTTSVENTRFTKLLWYGAIMNFQDGDVQKILTTVRERFPGITRCFVGNILDKARVGDIFRDVADISTIENSHETALGLWRSEEEVIDLADRSGWKVKILRMPPEYDASAHSYDAILTRPASPTFNHLLRHLKAACRRALIAVRRGFGQNDSIKAR